MRHSLRLLGFFVGTIAIFLLLNLPLHAQAQLTEQSKLAIDGIGPIRVGMTVAQAEDSARTQLVGGGEGSCYHLRPQSEPQGLALMVISDRQDGRRDRDQDRIARVDVYPGSRVTTLSGAKIGDTEEQIQSLYPGRIQVSPHNYTGYRGGHYLTFVPQDEADRNYRLVFETLKGRVTTFRSGKLPEVEFVEGCA